VYYGWFGDSIFYAPSGAEWQEQRKHVAAAFYREKTQLLLKATMSAANSRVAQWREKYANLKVKGPEGYMKLTLEVTDLLVEATLEAVFGHRSLGRQVEYVHNGQVVPGITLGPTIKGLGHVILLRIYHPLRLMFSVFDFADLNHAERESTVNLNSFKASVRQMIQERREELEDPNCTTKN